MQLHEFISSSESTALYIKFALLFPSASLYIFTSSDIDFHVPFYHAVIQYYMNLLQLFAVGFHFYCLT